MRLSRASVGLAVRAVREAARLTLSDLAQEVGMTTASLSRTENGLRDIEFAEAVAISAAVRIELETLRTLAETFEHAGTAAAIQQKSQLQSDLRELQRAAIEAAVEQLNS